MNFRFFNVLVVLSVAIANYAIADNQVPVFLGEAQFYNGDYIKIESVTSTGKAFEVGATVTVIGTYTLNSTDDAKLCFYTTQKLKPGQKPVATSEQKTQRLRAKRGNHTFSLSKVATGNGGPHLTFYNSETGVAFGGIYFGDKTNVWMKKGWSYEAPKPVQVGPRPANKDQISTAHANRIGNG